MLRVVGLDSLQQCLLGKRGTRKDKSQDLITVILGRLKLNSLEGDAGASGDLVLAPVTRSRVLTERIFSSASVSVATDVMFALTSPTAITLSQGKCRIEFIWNTVPTVRS
jgi:hypothetical protein